MIYLDNNSTTQLLPQVQTLLHKIIDSPIGNPEALGNVNISAKRAINESRKQVAKFLKTVSEKIIFTSSGSESNTIGILSSIVNNKKKKIVCSQIEHASVTALLQLISTYGFMIEEINTLPSGLIDYAHASSLIDEKTAAVIVQLVNNETGVIQPVAEIVNLAKQVGAVVHCDGAQAVGKMDVDIELLGCDYFSFTAHKFHGPAGIGGLWVNHANMNAVYPLIPGGSQEYGKRGGTHNVLGILGMGAAIRHKQATLSDSLAHTQNLRDTFEELLRERCENNIIINGGDAKRITNTSNVQFLHIDGKALYLRLLQEDIICSQSSACTAQYPEPSTTLTAMRLSHEEAFNSIRFSFSELNTKKEVLSAVDIIATLYWKIRNTLEGRF